MTFQQLVKAAEKMVEDNLDPLAVCLGSRLSTGKDCLLALFDQSIRDLCPHAQTVQREAYRPPMEDAGAGLGFNLECKSVAEVLRMFSRCGMRPKDVGVSLCEAFLFSMKSHTPYALDDEKEDLDQRPDAGAFSRFVADKVSRACIKDMRLMREEFAIDLYTKSLPDFWRLVKEHPLMKDRFGKFVFDSCI